MRRLARSMVLLATLGGCAADPVRVEDDAFLDDATSLSARSSDELHLPYMLGAQVRLSVATENGRSPHDFRVEIVDDGVLRMDSREEGGAVVTAVAPGTTRIRLIDEADESQIVEREIEVRVPDELRVVPRRDRLIGSVARLERVTLLEGSVARFDLRAFADGERLYGLHGIALGPDRPAHVDAGVSPDGSLTLVGATLGASTLELFAGTEPLLTLDAIVVAESAIDHVEILVPDERRAEDGDSLHAGAVCVARDGTRIEGAEPTWTSDVVAGRAVGDVLAYTFDRDASTEVTASYAGHVDHASIHASAAQVFSSDAVRCSAVPGARGSLLVLLSAAGVALGSGRRARRATKRTT